MTNQHKAVITGMFAGAAGLSLLLGRRVILQALLVLIVGFLATGKRYRWIYILYKTLPRDIRILERYIVITTRLWWWEKRKQTVPKIFMQVARTYPNKVAFRFEKKLWTFSQVDEYSNKVANYFRNQGFKRNDTIALMMDSRPEFVFIWLGLAKIGVVTALINSNLRKGPLIHCINAASSSGLIYGSELAEAVEDIMGSMSALRLYKLCEDDSQQKLQSSEDLGTALKTASGTQPVEITEGSSGDKLVYIYTSGTTGLPKAAVVTNLRYMVMAVGVNMLLKITQDDVVYDPLPLYHTAGGAIGIGQALLFGITVTIRRKFSASNYWTDCIQNNCTVAQYIGEMCRYLLSVPPKSEDTQHKVRLMFGNGLRPQIWREFTKRFGIKKIGEFYGATEGNSNIVNIDGTVGAVGFVPRYATAVYPVILIKVDEETGEPIRDANGFCIRCNPGEPGLCIGKIDPKKAVSKFNGYADKKASEKKILKNVFSMGDQAFNTGDILVMDEFGYFYFKDRTGDTFRWRGENVATSEVEAVISNIVGLKDVVVYGVEIPNVEGKAGMAAIVDDEGLLNIESFAAGVKQHLPPYAWPVIVRILPQLPITGTYKLKKRELQVEGYNPSTVKDRMYFLDKGAYVPLNEELYSRIVNGGVRL
ncbi:long-chain fatty acid transport protein 1-like [Schistocerca cancellata]|uniref:long-chain fatty acid transport protein 1-like n=1 Tax=Schistocerca cancellata TaxID=274614 RepID=UPI002117D9EF|nr:long-chain fatty acid transport protein 1-like [Schistocerca cancellata]